jgi:hypothetical protein
VVFWSISDYEAPKEGKTKNPSKVPNFFKKRQIQGVLTHVP